MPEVEQLEFETMVGAEIIPLQLAITAMRDSGYKNTAYALAELIDNAIQADAKAVEVMCIERRELVSKRERQRLNRIAVLDNGSGMDASTLRNALQFGNGTRLGDRTGIGRFGMGLPNASISQSRRVDVWSWQNGQDNAVHSYLALDDIEAGTMRHVPEPAHSPVPEEWNNLSDGLGHSGTLVIWSDLDIQRLTWKSARHTLYNTEQIVGRIYRRFIMDQSVTIRLLAKVEDDDSTQHSRLAVFNDPLYLSQSPSMPSPFDKKPMFEEVFKDRYEIEYRGATYNVDARYSVATMDTVTEAGTRDRGSTEFGRHAGHNIGLSVLRARREIVLDQGWCIGYDPRERWWGAEIEFPPTLDELFGVTNNKQAATHFAELAATDWKQLAEEGEEFIDVVNRLKEDDDPRGWLLVLSDSIQRNLEQLRREIKGQGAGQRSSRKSRHHEADDLTATVNKSWKERSTDKPIEGEDRPTTKESLEEIQSDLIKNKRYSETDAKELVSLIDNKKLKVVFLESDFTNPFELFNVETKGNVTEIIFNRRHPAFNDIFGTVTTADENISDLSNEEIQDKLLRATNAIKIIFAAWARYEREAGLGREPKLQKVRFHWGQIAATFLSPDDDRIM